MQYRNNVFHRDFVSMLKVGKSKKHVQPIYFKWLIFLSLMSMKTILVPVDFSDCSALAVRFAVNLQKKDSGNIVLLHVLDEGETDTSLGTTGSWAGAEDVPTVPYMM